MQAAKLKAQPSVAPVRMKVFSRFSKNRIVPSPSPSNTNNNSVNGFGGVNFDLDNEQEEKNTQNLDEHVSEVVSPRDLTQESSQKNNTVARYPKSSMTSPVGPKSKEARMDSVAEAYGVTMLSGIDRKQAIKSAGQSPWGTSNSNKDK
jgi:hypothetical protein